MNKVKLTRYIVQSLKDEGASHVFMIPGGFVDNFLQDLTEVEGINAIVCASEGGAAMMADGFARASGNFGVCMGISGPGASNMLTGLSISCADEVPVLAITGDSPLRWRDRDSIQDSGTQGLKTIDLFKHISAVQYQLYEAQLAGDYIRRSVSSLKSSSPGVAHLSVPLDVQTSELVYDYQPLYSSLNSQARIVDIGALDQALSLIASTVNVVLLIGAGVRKSNASSVIFEFSERFNIPVATTMSAKGDFPESHALSLGVFGWSGSGTANETLMSDEVECLIVVGSKLGQIATMCWSDDLRSNRILIQLDINSSNMNQSYQADVAVISDAKAAFDYYLALPSENSNVDRLAGSVSTRKDWVETCRAIRPRYYDTQDQESDVEPIHPARVIEELCLSVPEDTQLFVDNGAHTFFAMHYWKSTLSNHCFNIIKYSGAMGWAIPASIGAKFCKPDKVTVAVVGDGCMLMHGIEIQTAARYRQQKIIFVVLNNKAHGNPKLRFSGASDNADKLTDIVDHSWAGFAESLGLNAFTVSESSNLSAVFERALQLDTAVLIDVKCGLYPTPTKVFDETFMKEFNQYIEL